MTASGQAGPCRFLHHSSRVCPCGGEGHARESVAIADEGLAGAQAGLERLSSFGWPKSRCTAASSVLITRITRHGAHNASATDQWCGAATALQAALHVGSARGVGEGAQGLGVDRGSHRAPGRSAGTVDQQLPCSSGSVGRSDALGVEVLGQACHLAERDAERTTQSGRARIAEGAEQRPAGGRHIGPVWARPVEALEHDKCTALQAAPRHGFLSPRALHPPKD